MEDRHLYNGACENRLQNQGKDRSNKTNEEKKKFLRRNDKMWQRSMGHMEVWQEKIYVWLQLVSWDLNHIVRHVQKYTLVPTLVFFSNRLCAALKK